MEEKLKSLELWFFRHMFKVSWLDRQINEIFLDRVGAHRSLINIITEANVFFSHICRKGKLENLVSTGKIQSIEGKRACGRQKQGFMASMRRRMG